MNDVRVSWVPATPGGRCDFCSVGIALGPRVGQWIVACLHDLTVTVDDPLLHIDTPGDWCVCGACQQALGIDLDTLSVPIERVAAYHRQVAIPIVVSGLGASAEALARIQQHLRYAVGVVI